MILAYHRPETVEEALRLLKRPGIDTRPLGGGTVLSQPSEASFEVVDLQAAGLNRLEQRGSLLLAGAAASLQSLLEMPALPDALGRAIRHEASQNLRQAATLAGTLVACDGRSPLATALLALDAAVAVMGHGEVGESISLGDLLPLRGERLRGRLITQVHIPLNASLAYEYAARTPADRPLVCAAAARWPSGRTRLALGGYGSAPRLAMDGPEPGGVEEAARSAFAQAGDQWASREYRQDVAAVLAARCLQTL